jgi:hypothetical protein
MKLQAGSGSIAIAIVKEGKRVVPIDYGNWLLLLSHIRDSIQVSGENESISDCFICKFCLMTRGV